MAASQWLSLRASAGSGKTFSLTSRFIYLLFLGAKVGEILTLTFTRKAQGEMQSRILHTLESLARTNCDMTSNPYIAELRKLGLSDEFMREHIARIYDDFLHSTNRIMTFDALFNMIVRKFSFYVGLLNNYEIRNSQDFTNEAFNAVLANLAPGNFEMLVSLCYADNLSVNNVIGILEGIKNYDLDEILAESGDVNAPDSSALRVEIIEHYNALKAHILEVIDGKDSVKLISGAFSHNLSEDSGEKDIMKLFRSDDSYVLLSEANLARLAKLGADMTFIEARLARIREAFREFFAKKESNVFLILRTLHKAYNEHKMRLTKERNTLSFSDLNRFCYDLMHKHIDRDFFYFRLDARVRHILVDEFQDTNITQYRILEPLIDEIKSGVGRIGERSLFFVGDEKQAIYGFRGSDSRLFRIISETLQMSEDSLPNNYRSARHIVEFVNRTFSEKFSDYTMQIPHRAENGYVKIISVEKDAAFESVKNRVDYLLAHNRKDIMILTRTNDTARDVRDYLLRENPKLNIALGFRANEHRDFLIIFNALKYLNLADSADSALPLESVRRIDSAKSLFLNNALKLSGEAFGAPSAEFHADSTNPSQLTLLAMKHFGVFSNIALSVLEKSFAYENLGDFVGDLESMDIEVSEDVKYDVRISNIHKSKGLEFDDVIVVECRGDSNRDLFYYDYDGLNIRQICHSANAKRRKAVDENFARILQNAKDAKEQDLVNLLYVGFTRAKESLYIIKSETRGKNLFSHINLPESLEMGEDVASAPSDEKIAQDSTPCEILQESFGRQSDFAKNPKRHYRTLTQIKGVALHLAMEYAIKYRDLAHLRDILLNRFGLVLRDSHITEILESVEKILHNPTIARILAQNLSVRCEVSYINNAKNIRRIDCVIEGAESVYLLDYKSSDVELDEKKRQLREYKDFATAHFAKNIEAYLCFADGSIAQV